MDLFGYGIGNANERRNTKTMTEGDRVCPYCIKPMMEIGYGSVMDVTEWVCKSCMLKVQIREMKEWYDRFQK